MLIWVGMYRELNADKVVQTIEKLRNRIDDRFPESGLSKVVRELEDIAEVSKRRIAWISKPNLWIRAGVGLFIAACIAVLVYTAPSIDLKMGSFGIVDLISILEASINDILLIGAAIFFLFTIEGRIKRARALKVLNELRSVAHVIDMHQLTKDPSRDPSMNTKHSPDVQLTRQELKRYLDYCSEMLALTSKVAALYAQGFDDGVVLDTINELEDLTTGLSRKIWQKIIIIEGRGD